MLVLALLLGACTKGASSAPENGVQAVIYKSPSCGCCVGYAGALKDAGYAVDIRLTEDMDAIKQRYQIPVGMQSCHTTVIGDKVIEGHMPLDVVEEIVAQDAVKKVALPNMPAGTPGMPGIKQGPWTIYALDNGTQVYKTI